MPNESERIKNNSLPMNSLKFLMLGLICHVTLWLPILYYVSTTDSLWEWRLLLTDMIVCLPLAVLNAWIAERLEYRLTKQPLKIALQAKAVTLILIVNILLSFPISGIELTIYDYLMDDSPWDWSGEFLNAYGLSFIFAFLTSVSLLLRFAEIAKNKAQDALEKDRLLNDERLRALTSQINPHFLFNNISVGVGLINTRPDDASDYFSTMAAVYRQMLQNSRQKYTSIEEELDFPDKYVYMMRIRFGNSFRLTINNDSEPPGNIHLIPGTLQLIFENIFKHNALSDDDPLQITLNISSKAMTIANDYRPISAATP